MCPWPVAKQCQAPSASSLSVPVAVPARVSCVGTQNTSHILFEFCFQFVHVPHREWQWTERVPPLSLSLFGCSRRGPIDSSLRNSITINTCRDIPRVGGSGGTWVRCKIRGALHVSHRRQVSHSPALPLRRGFALSARSRGFLTCATHAHTRPLSGCSCFGCCCFYYVLTHFNRFSSYLLRGWFVILHRSCPDWQ